jgi:hypothetical protein
MTSPLKSMPANADAGESLVKLAATLPPSKQFPWYQASFGSRLTTECRQLLEEYSRIPPEKVERHVYEMVWFAVCVSCLLHTLTKLAIRKERHSMGHLPLPLHWGVLVSHPRSIQSPQIRLASSSPEKRRQQQQRDCRSSGSGYRYWDLFWPGSAQTSSRWRDSRPAHRRRRLLCL